MRDSRSRVDCAKGPPSLRQINESLRAEFIVSLIAERLDGFSKEREHASIMA